MTTKLWIYFFTLIGGIIQISLQTYNEKPDDFYVICFTIAGAIAMTLATACKNRIRSLGEDATFFLLFGLVIYLFFNDYASIFKQFGYYWFYLIAVIVAHKTYAESKETHRKNLIRYSDAVLKTITRYTSHDIKTSLVRDSLVFQIWLRDMDNAQKDLRKELYEGNFVSDFSFKELWFERKRLKKSILPQRSSSHKDIPFKKYTLHETVKLAEEVGICHEQFLEFFSDFKNNKFITSAEKFVNASQTAEKLQDILNDIRKRDDGTYYMCDHHLIEQFQDTEGEPTLQNA